MKKILSLSIALFTLWSCGSAQPARIVHNKPTSKSGNYTSFGKSTRSSNYSSFGKKSENKKSSSGSYSSNSSVASSGSNIANTTTYTKTTTSSAKKYSNSSGKVASILSDAEKYLGTPYRLGGMTYSGFDCSGFVNTVFAENDIKLTRRSADQAKEGVGVKIEDVELGDLLFFATAGGKRVSHVGIVHTITDEGEIKFIHASTSKGVIISSLDENYWDKAYLFARRVL